MQEALRTISTAFIEAEFAVERLEEPGLEAIAGELRRLANDGSHTALSLALAGIANTHLAIIASRRSPDGVWYAVLDLIEWEDNQRSGCGIADYYERCADRGSAEQAVRKLMAARLKEVSGRVTMESRVLTELEWLADCSERAKALDR